MQAWTWIGSLGIAVLLVACGDDGSSAGNSGAGGSNTQAPMGGAPGAAGSPGVGGSSALTSSRMLGLISGAG
jgi:hypothetical protein